MHIVDTINNILSLESLQAKELRLDEVSDSIEYNNLNLNQESIKTLLGTLINAAINTKEFALQESLLNLCSTILTFGGNNQALDLDDLNDNITSLKGSSLEHAILCLGFSKNKKYILTLKNFSLNDNNIIRNSALEALNELNI
jgi:hypothetical protein